MDDKTLIHKIQLLKEVKADQEWADFCRQNLVHRAFPQVEASKRESFWLVFNVIKGRELVPVRAVVPFLVVFSLILSGFVWINETPENIDLSAIYNEANLKENASKPVVNSPNLYASDLSDEKQIEMQKPASESYTSLPQNGGDLVFAAFLQSLRGRLDKVWALAENQDDRSVLSIAKEAEEFYAEEDYDAVLRALEAVEQMLK